MFGCDIVNESCLHKVKIQLLKVQCKSQRLVKAYGTKSLSVSVMVEFWRLGMLLDCTINNLKSLLYCLQVLIEKAT